MRKKTIKRIDNKIAKIGRPKIKIIINTKIMYNFLWRQIIKDIGKDGIDVELWIEHNKKGTLLEDISTLQYYMIPRYIDFDELQKKFYDDGIIIKEYPHYDPLKHLYNYQIKYTLDELNEIMNNEEKNNSFRKKVKIKK